ncbi:MAG: putative transferase [Betaproteobacteria bacterium]|nr:putative transferase [Betaproteobacteria bacterium]
MTRIGRILQAATQVARRLRLRCIDGCAVPAGTMLGRNVRINGSIRIGRNVALDDDVSLTGKIVIGDQVRVGRGAEFNGNIRLGNEAVIGSFAILSTGPEGSLDIGADTYVNSFNVIGAWNSVEIGPHCIFAAFVQITDATHGIDDLAVMTKHAPISAAPVRLGRNVWLGARVTVMMGSSIGDDAVVGAQSLVRGNLPERSISVGTPARVLRVRQQ